MSELKPCDYRAGTRCSIDNKSIVDEIVGYGARCINCIKRIDSNTNE